MKRRYGFFLLVTAFCSGKRLILKYQEEPTGDRFSGAKLTDELQIILLKHTAVRIGLPFKLLSHRLNMPVNVRTFCQHLELYLHRSDFQIADKRPDDASLFLGTSKEKIDRDDFYRLDIAVIPTMRKLNFTDPILMK